MNGITVGEKIKQLRTRKGLLQSDLADHLSVTNGAISNWETNRRLPSIEELKKICLFFDVPLDYFAESPNFEFSEEHVQYHRSPKMASVTIRHLGPCCEDCTYLIGAALMLFLSGMFSGQVQIFLWFFGLYSILVHLISTLIRREGNRQSLIETVTYPEGSVLVYRHQRDVEQLTKEKSGYSKMMIITIILEILFLMTVFGLFSYVKFYLGIILMIFMTLGMFAFDYHRLFHFQNGFLMNKEIAFDDFKQGYRYPTFMISVIMSLFILLLMSLILLLIEDISALPFYRFLGLLAVSGHFAINLVIYIRFKIMIRDYDLCSIDGSGRLTFLSKEHV